MSTDEDFYTTTKTFEPKPESKIYSNTCISPRNNEKPVFVTKISPAIVTSGNVAKFTVTVSGFPKPIVQWYHNNQVITSSSFYTCIEEKEEYTLVISKVYRELEGEYSCTANNKFGKATCKTYLRVVAEDTKNEEQATGQPPHFIQKIKSVQCTVGELAMFEYKVTGSPFPEIRWFRGSSQIEPSKCYIIVSNVDGSGFIKISSIQESDGGLYSCKASNPLGEAVCSAQLIIHLDTAGTVEKSVSVSEHATESCLYSVNLPAQARTSVQEGQHMIYTIGTEERQSLFIEQVETLQELDKSDVHQEHVTHHKMLEEATGSASKQPQLTVASPLRQVQTATITTAVHENQCFTEQYLDRITSPVIVEPEMTEEQRSCMMSAISENVTPLITIKADPLSRQEEHMHSIPEPKQVINSHQVETNLIILSEEYKNITYPKGENTFRVAEGIKLLYTPISSEILQLSKARSSPLSSSELSECPTEREKPKPFILSVSEAKQSLTKEGTLKMSTPLREVAHFEEHQMLKSAAVTEEKQKLVADKTEMIPDLVGATSAQFQKELDQVLHLQLISDQDTLPCEGIFTSKKPAEEQADMRKSPIHLETVSVDRQTAVHCEYSSESSLEQTAVSVKPREDTPAKLYLQSTHSETILSKEGLLSAKEPDHHEALQRREKVHKHAATLEEKRNLTADYSTNLDHFVKGFKSESRKEPKPLNILNVVSEPMQLPKESHFTSTTNKQNALVQKEDQWNIMHATLVSDRRALPEGHTDNLQVVERFTSSADVEPNLPPQSLHIESKAVSNESCTPLDTAQKDLAEHIKEGQSVRQPISIEEKQTLTAGVCQVITKSEEATVNIMTQHSEPLLVSESQESKTFPKELMFVIPALKTHSLDIKPQLKSALLCAVACDQQLILAELASNIKVVQIEEVKVQKEPQHTMLTYRITTTSVPMEITLAFEGDSAQTADLRNELQAVLESILYQESQVFTSEEPNATAVLKSHRVQPGVADVTDIHSPVVESVQLTENVKAFTAERERDDSVECTFSHHEQIISLESKHQMTIEAKSDTQAMILTERHDIKMVTSDMPMAPIEAEDSPEVLSEKEKLRDVTGKQVPTFVTPLKNIAVVENSVVTFTANIKHDGEVNWFYNGEIVESGNGFECSKDGGEYTLSIDNVIKKRHEGEYTCQAVSDGGEASTSARLEVLSRGWNTELFCQHNSAI